MTSWLKLAAPMVVLTSLGAAQVALAADEAQMMTKCNSYAARHLGVSTSDISELNFIGMMSDGKTYGVTGAASNGQAFQCVFNSKGTHVVQWNHTAPAGCPDSVSEADRWLYPDCN